MEREKISIITDEISQDPSVVAEFLKQNNVNAVEIRTMNGSRVPDIDPRIWEDFRMRCVNEGWKIVGLSPGIFKGEFRDDQQIEQDLDIVLPDTIGLAVECGAEFIITFGFMAPETAEIPNHIAAILSDAAGMCEGVGIKLLLENEPGSFADTGERTRKLIDKVAHPNLFANWDPCNAAIFNDPGKLARSARALGEKIKHVHVKDGNPKPEGGHYPSYCLIPDGAVGWKEHLTILRDMGYDGHFGIETHFEPVEVNTRETLSRFRNLLNETDFYGRSHGT